MIGSKLLIQILLSFAALLAVIFGLRITKGIVRRFGIKHDLHQHRFFYVNKITAIFYTILFLLVISIIWGFDIGGLPVYFASFFGLVGIAFFASWSLLSNITASMIIFFSYQLRISDKIKIYDGDNSVEGRVKDMNMFTVLIETEEGHVISYPNNLVIQKPIQLINEK
ncbi:MAG: mechanosensitive ion channel domain-containing protein [Bacteroidales bacterium]